jgi:PDZ domain
MTVDLRLEVIRKGVTEVAVLERDLAERLERVQQLFSGQPKLLAIIQRLLPMVLTNCDQLASYLQDFDVKGRGRAQTGPLPTARRENATILEELAGLCLELHSITLRYTALHAVAARLYEPRLREIASEHLKAHAHAAFSTARLLPAAVAWELAQDGLNCACVCPMCGIGASGCVAMVAESLSEAWHGESGLANVGVQGGDVIIAIDGQRVQSRETVQAALRKRKLGDEVRILTQRGSESPSELKVRHAGDYPKT